MNKILVVGGAGYIGGALTDLLAKNNKFFTVYDNLMYEDIYLKPVDLIKADVREKERLLKLAQEYDTVIWLAALVGDGACALSPDLTLELNQLAPIEFAAQWDGRFIFTSTCSVYGANHDKNLTEEVEPNPLSLYAGTKLEVEKALIDRPKTTIFRLGTVHGLGDLHSRVRLDLVVNILTLKATIGEPLTIFGGEQWRPIIHVNDVAKALFAAAESDHQGIYNVSYDNVNIKEIVVEIEKQIKEVEVTYVDMMFEDMRNYHVSTKKFNNSFKMKLTTSLEESIIELNKFYKSGRLKDPSNPVYNNQNFLEWELNQK